MTEASAFAPFAALVVAAGEGSRAGQPVPKQFAPWHGKPLLRHSVESLLMAGANPLVIAVPANGEETARRALKGLEGIVYVSGGATRQQSVLAGLEAMADEPPGSVLIHDAARPHLPFAVIERSLEALRTFPGAIPVLPVVDSLAHDVDGMMDGMADRDSLRRVQTPQAFRYADILDAHRAWRGVRDAGDDAQVLSAAGGSVALIAGDERLKKITFSEDFQNRQPSFRTGMGFDVHRLVAGEELWLGGIKIEHEKGLAGHSDADVVLHALVDALLGAIGEGDIGMHFPPSDPQWSGAASHRFVEHAVNLVTKAGYSIGNVDLTIICEAPKIGPHRETMRSRIADLLTLEHCAINVKATTTEGLGLTGRGEGIAAQAIVSLYKDELS